MNEQSYLCFIYNKPLLCRVGRGAGLVLPGFSLSPRYNGAEMASWILIIVTREQQQVTCTTIEIHTYSEPSAQPAPSPLSRHLALYLTRLKAVIKQQFMRRFTISRPVNMLRKLTTKLFIKNQPRIFMHWGVVLQKRCGHVLYENQNIMRQYWLLLFAGVTRGSV